VETSASEVITVKVRSHDVPIPTRDEVNVVQSEKTEAGISAGRRFDRAFWPV
jgi:hypothetical protein